MLQNFVQPTHTVGQRKHSSHILPDGSQEMVHVQHKKSPDRPSQEMPINQSTCNKHFTAVQCTCARSKKGWGYFPPH